ncbi:MAG: response regulator [Methylacidiphilales bacterium]|nr:response regulator [Candidatus Methylacidiphilales bacterium]
MHQEQESFVNLVPEASRNVTTNQYCIWEMGTETVALAVMFDCTASDKQSLTPKPYRNFEEVINNAISSNLINLVCRVDKLVDVLTSLENPSLSIDAVVLDLSLQNADDFEQISCIHSLFPQIPIVIISDVDDEAKLLQAIKAGSDEYLIKSQITPLLLRRCLLAAIERRDRESRQKIVEMKQNELQMRQRKEAAEAGSRTKSSFLATMSHELRTPLNAIMGLSQLLQQEMGENLSEKQQEYVNCIYTSGEHLLALIDDVLDLSQVEAGKEELQLVSLSVRDLCRNVISTVCDRANAKGLEIAVEITDDVETCIADERRLKQMLLNLLTNAIKFTQVGRVLLEVKYTELGINFIVADTGIGIEREHFKLLFEPFKQLDSQLNRHYEGTGLGLALTKKLARLHGGDVTIESTVGVGSKFTLLLPHPNSLNTDF